MSDRASTIRRLLVIVPAVFALLAVMSVVAAQADPYGEIQNFGEGEIQTPEKAMGIDPETGNIYVVDQFETTKFKIQDFSASGGGTYKSIASVVFTPKDPSRLEGPDEVEGVAIDPKLHRLYVLALEKRRESPEHPVPDPETEAAGALYAYSTTPEGNKLKPAEGTSATEKGVLASQEELNPLSKEFGVSLLEPSGIAVDPKNDNVLILATEDRGKLSNPEEEVYEKETTMVLQSIEPTGALGPRYIDSRIEENPVTKKQEEVNYFHECGCVNSPAFTKNGNLYVVGERDEIAEIPLGTPSTKEPVPVIPIPVVRMESAVHEGLTEIPEEVPGPGDNLSISPEGAIWARARVKYQLAGPTQEFEYGGALEFTPEFAEQGWAGGQSLASETGQCVIDDIFGKLPAIAAGKEGTLFVLVRTLGSGTDPTGPRIIELGPNGSGCPHATATLSAEAGGSPLQENEPVSIVEKVTFASKLTQANALSVEWEFGDGMKQTVNTREQQAVEIQHTFTKTGQLTIKEKIHTDNLATPVLEKEWKIDVVGPPKAVTEEGIAEGVSATLKGTVNPNGQQVTECKFEYGTTNLYGSQIPCASSPGSGEEPVEVSAHLSGLVKDTTYHFRIVAVNKHDEKGEGLDQTFATGSASKPITEGAAPIGESSATLHAMVNPEGASTECKFEYGTTNAYGSHVPCASSPGSGTGPVPVSASPTGLSASTTYHYRIVAESGGVPSYGEDKTFTTERSKQRIEEEEAEAKKHQEEEAAVAAAAKKHQEEEAATAAKKHQEEEAAAAAAKKHQEEEVAKKKEEEGKAKSKPPTRAQLLTKALKSCKKGPKGKRAKCEATARKRYGSKAKSRKKKK